MEDGFHQYPHNIYLLEAILEKTHISYDCNDGQVIVADSAKEARSLCDIADEGDIWSKSELSTCKKIGVTNRHKGIVLVSNRGA